MAVYTVSFDGTRFSVVDTYTNWSNFGGSGAGGAAESPIAYQNAIAANRKQSTTGGALGGIQYDPGAGAVDMTGATRRLFFCKVIISDSFDCNTSEGLRVSMGSANNAYNSYNLAGSTAKNDAYLKYPAQGGYILTAIDPTISFWTIATTGTIDTTAIDWFGVQGSWITGQAKAENIAMDAIDIGTGLYITGGTGADPVADFVGYVEKDQNVSTVRWGCVSGAGATVNAWCVLRAGGATEFYDTTSIVNFKDGYHSAGLTGVLHELDTASATFTMGATLIGEGKLYNAGAIDTRPDYTVTGTTMTALYNLTGTIRNFRNVVLNSKVHADGAAIEAQLLTQATAHIENSTIKTNALTSIACLQDPTFGTTSGLHDTTFVQSGAGHAIEIDATGSYDFNNLFFSGYGADASDAAAIDVTTTAAVTINVNGGDTPTYKTAGTGNVTIVAGSVTVDAFSVTDTGAAVNDAIFHVEASGTTKSPFPVADTVTIVNSGTTATVTHATHGMATGDKVVIRGASLNANLGVFVITVTGAGTYTYTMGSAPGSSPTGTITSTFVILNGLPTAGQNTVTMTRVFPSNQLFTGTIRKSSSAPYYKQASLSGTVSSTTGASITGVMVSDD